MTLENCYSDENKLRSVFSWLTLIGAGRKFGTLPISWYQMHQCACIDILSGTCGVNNPLRCRQGQIQANVSGRWITAMSAIELFQRADNRIRSTSVNS